MNDKILRRVFEHAEFADKNVGGGNNRILTALVGVQNYSLEREDNVIKTKSIFIPSFSELIFEDTLLEHMTMPNQELNEAFDVREMMVRLLTKLEDIEILYTPYIDIDPKYVDFYDQLLGMRDSIAYYYPSRNLEMLADKIQDYCGKARQLNMPSMLAQAYALYQQMGRYSKNCAYEEVLDLSDCRDQYLQIRDGELSSEEMFDIAMELNIKSEQIRGAWQNRDIYNIGVEKELRSIVRELFRKEYGAE